jgi:4-diphosphocytidyl-2-C-methyl-D-erythritol kinase
MLEVTVSENSLIVDAPAKVNLTLRVLGVRRDGYHELESVVAAVGMADRIVLEPADDVRLVCSGADISAGEDNLVMMAARALARQCGVRAGAQIRLDKHVPAGRGFGGGSSDAAATLAGLNVLWHTKLTRSDLARLGASLGSDVPLFFGSPVCVMRGRGEVIEPVGGRPAWHIVLAWPEFGLPTPEVYAAYDRLGASAGVRPAATEILKHFASPPRDVRELLINDLEPAAGAVRRGRMDVRAILSAAGAQAVGMTGSGSAYFALADSETEARRVTEAVRALGVTATVTSILKDGQRKYWEKPP